MRLQVGYRYVTGVLHVSCGLFAGGCKVGGGVCRWLHNLVGCLQVVAQFDGVSAGGCTVLLGGCRWVERFGGVFARFDGVVEGGCTA